MDLTIFSVYIHFNVCISNNYCEMALFLSPSIALIYNYVIQGWVPWEHQLQAIL